MTEMTMVLQQPQQPYIKQCHEVVFRFCEYDWSYKNYDCVPVTEDSVLRVEEIELAYRMGARFPRSLIQVLIDRVDTIRKALSQISPTIIIFDEKIPWQALESLFKACIMPRLNAANITKILHKKRPQIIPILDSIVVQKYLEPLVQPHIPTAPEERMVLYIKQLKRDAEVNREVLIEIQKRLVAQGKLGLSPIRVLDILIWTYFSRPEWLFL